MAGSYRACLAVFETCRRQITFVLSITAMLLTSKNLNSLLSIDNAWSNKKFSVFLTFRILQHTSSEVNGYNCYKHLKNSTIKRGTSDKIKNNDKIDATES